jgi:hypothetical protein
MGIAGPRVHTPLRLDLPATAVAGDVAALGQC